eukprot:GFUD01021916.1.p1 GENE.GFUD01021916.1~~GFUD01021916.1.p1  ORF type:complete len:455 (+),score=113.02 GFUD01021916.1:112-1476(+)
MDGIIRTFEEKILDAKKLEEEIKRLKKLRSDIDRKISEKETSPILEYLKYQELLPKLQIEIQIKKHSGLEEPTTQDDKQDYMITRKELGDIFAEHFVGAIFFDSMPFQGLAPLFGINLPKNSTQLTMNTVVMRQDFSRYGEDIVKVPSAIIMNGAWQTIIKYDRFQDNRKKAVEEISKHLVAGNLPTKFFEWLGTAERSGYVQEMSRRGFASTKWRFLVDFLKHGSCSLEAGRCDVCGADVGENSKSCNEFCKLGNFCSDNCKSLFGPVHKPLCKFIYSKSYIEIKWDEKSKHWVENRLTPEEIFKATKMPENRIKDAVLLREEGDDFYKSKHYQSAMKSYYSGLQISEDIIKIGKDDDQELKQNVFKVKISLLLTMSQCELKQKKFSDAIKRCDNILALQSNNSKAMFFKGKAFAGLKKKDDAITSYMEAMKLDPTFINTNKCKKEINKLEKV